VLENRSPNQVNTTDSKVKTPDEGGEHVINTELEILTSLDLALAVAEEIGPDKILAKLGGGANLQAAAGVVRYNVLPEVPKQSNVIRLIFKHPDPAIVQPVLSKLISLYLKKHAEIHRAVGVFDDFLTLETENLRASLGQTEDSLRQAKTNAQIISVDDSKKHFSEQMGRIQQAIFDAEAELAECQSTVSELEKLLPEAGQNGGTNSSGSKIKEAISAVGSNSVSATNVVAATTAVGSSPAAIAATNAAADSNKDTVPADQIAQYRRLSTLLESLSRREQDLLLQFTPETSLVKAVRTQMVENEKLKRELETSYPGLLAVKVAETKTVIENGPRASLLAERTRATSLKSKIRTLNAQLAQIRKQASALDEAEGSITTLQRKKDLQEAQYKYFQANLEQTRFDKALGASRMSNISVIQLPSPPFQVNTKMHKTMAMLALGSIAAALALAFLLEFYVDKSVRRPGEIESRLGFPLFVTIPRMHLNGKARSLKAGKNVPQLAERNHVETPESERAPAQSSAASNGDGETVLAPRARDTDSPSEVVHHPISTSAAKALHPFYEALRDRLILYFEVKNLTHKPKLVAVTSCASGSGVSTAASGLAATLSETGDGNVLLVDMNFQGEAHQFYRGKLACDLDDALEQDKRGNALVQENLYVVSENGHGDKLPRVLPKRFKHLVPKLKASDYDYIIFDLPPVSQISATPKLARFMDMVFVVVESEKTPLEVVKRATGLLAESASNVGIILNKARNYVPKKLQNSSEF
jgi:uncharacterized protein involved in exopolysaccharide biosynthesis/Mrp family chromosome partitioning ATPase